MTYEFNTSVDTNNEVNSISNYNNNNSVYPLSRKNSLRHLIYDNKRRAVTVASSRVRDAVKTIVDSSIEGGLNYSLSYLESSDLKQLLLEQSKNKHHKRTRSEPILNSWDFGFRGQVFDYDSTSGSQTESACSDDEGSGSETFCTPRGPPKLLRQESFADLSLKNDIIFKTNSSGKSAVVAGTVEKLVQNLATEDLPDMEYVQIFVLTHQRFMTSEALLRQLIDNFGAPKPINSTPGTAPRDNQHLFIRSRIINVLKLWINASPDDFNDSDIFSILMNFVCHLENSSKDEEKLWAKQLQVTFDEKDEQVVFVSPRPPKPVAKTGSKLRQSGLIENFLDMQPKNIAKQMTLIDQMLVKKLKPKDLLKKGWDKTSTPPLSEISTRFDLISGWVTSEVVSTAHSKQRLLIVINFIHLIDELLRLNNFHSAMCVYVGLNKTLVARLAETWQALDKRLTEKWKSYDTLMTPFSNFKNLRAAIARAKRPIIPPITILSKDLTFMEENQDAYPADPRLLNFEKIYLIGTVLLDIHECQKATYDLEEITAIKSFLCDRINVLSYGEMELALRRVIKGTSKKDAKSNSSDKGVTGSVRLGKRSHFLKLFGEA